MSEAAAAEGLPVELSKRFEGYRAEVARVVSDGIEHPNFEMKRSASIARENLADRLDFIKLIQGLANAYGAEEKFIIVGADPKERKFYPLANADEFDPAKLTQVLSKYLDPEPRIEVFNNVQIGGGGSYVLIVLGPDQPRPVVAVCEGTSDKRTHFRQGEIWIKKGTSLRLAVRADLDVMYEQHINTEAETRAHRHSQPERGESGKTPVAGCPTF